MKTMQPPRPRRLEYAPARTWVTRIGPSRMVWAAIVLAVAIAAVLWTKPAIRRVQQWNREQQFLSLQRRALAYTAPADRVVYEEHPAEAAALRKREATYAPIALLDAATQTAATRPNWQPPVQLIEPLWTSYAAGPRPVAPSPVAAAFMGERTTPSGEARLVCVGIGMQAQRSRDGRWGMLRWLQAWSFKPGSLESADQIAPMGQMIIDSDATRPPGEPDPLSDDPSNPFAPPFPLRLYAGQRDPKNQSRFTIPYELNGRRGVITGILQDDGSVLLRPDIGWHGRLGTTVTWIPRFSPPVSRDGATTSSTTRP